MRKTSYDTNLANSQEPPKLRPGADVVAFQKREIARRYRRKSNYAGFRLPELIRLFGHLWGSELPDDRKGRFALYVAFQTLRECRSLPDQAMTEFADIWASWIDEDELAKLKDRVFEEPRRFKPHTIARRFGVTLAMRERLRFTTIGAVDCNRAGLEERRKAKRAKDSEARRRKAGAVPRSEYEASSEARTKPWSALGISESTYRRRKRKQKLSDDAGDSSPRPASCFAIDGDAVLSITRARPAPKAGLASAVAAATRPPSRTRRSRSISTTREPRFAKTG